MYFGMVGKVAPRGIYEVFYNQSSENIIFNSYFLLNKVSQFQGIFHNIRSIFKCSYLRLLTTYRIDFWYEKAP